MSKEEQFSSICKKCNYPCNLPFRDLYNLHDPLKDLWIPFHLADCLCTDYDTRKKNQLKAKEMKDREECPKTD